MRHTAIRTLFVLLVPICASGCLVPATITDVPPLTGQIVDANGSPVEAARVVIVRKRAWQGSDFVSSFPAGPDGKFNRDAHYHWTYWLIPAESWPTPLTVYAEAEGKKSPTTRIASGSERAFGIGQDGVRNLGTFRIGGQ